MTPGPLTDNIENPRCFVGLTFRRLPDRLDRAIAALRGKGNSRLTVSGKRDGRRRTLSAAQRRKITLGMKKHWAERKKKAA